MSKYRYGINEYAVRHEMAKDMMGTLTKIKEMGYEGIEFMDPNAYPATDLKKMLDDVGLVCCGFLTHLTLLQDDTIDSTIEYFKTVGAKYANVPWLADEMMAPAEKAIETAGIFNRIAAKLAPHGIILGFHNHINEMRYYPGTADSPFTTFFDHTDESINIEMDCAHVVNGRAHGILSLLRRYPNRFKTVHLKPYSYELGAVNIEDGYNSMIGEDDVPWGDVMRLCRTIGGTEWYLVEYEAISVYPELVGLELCMQRLKTMEIQGEI